MVKTLFLETIQNKQITKKPIWFMRQAGRYLPEYQACRKQAGGFMNLCLTPEYATEVTLQPIHRFNMDAAIIFSDILMIPYGLGLSLDFIEKQGPVLAKLESLDQLDQTNWQQRLKPVYQALQQTRAALPADKTLIGFAGSPWTVASYMLEGGSPKDFKTALQWVYSRPQEFNALINILVETTTTHLLAQVEAGADVLQIFDSWASALSDDLFNEYVIKPTRQIVHNIKAAAPHVPIIGFPRLAGANYLPFVKQTGVDVVSMDTTLPLEWAKEYLAPHVVLQGNLDPQLLVAGGKPLEHRIQHLLHTFASVPYIFNLGHGVVPYTPPEHVGQVIQAVQAWK